MDERRNKEAAVCVSKKELMREVQRLWNQVDSCDYKRYIKKLTCKLENVIKLKGLITIH